MVASAEVFQVQPSAFHSLTAWDTEEILFIGARPLHVRQAISFIDIYIYIIIFFNNAVKRRAESCVIVSKAKAVLAQSLLSTHWCHLLKDFSAARTLLCIPIP